MASVCALPVLKVTHCHRCTIYLLLWFPPDDWKKITKMNCVSWYISITPCPASVFSMHNVLRHEYIYGIWCGKTYTFIQALFHDSTNCPTLKGFFFISFAHLLFCTPKKLPDVMCTDGSNADFFHCLNASTFHLHTKATSGSHQMDDICVLLYVCPCCYS